MVDPRKFFSPCRVGQVVHFHQSTPTGVFCYGLVVDPLNIMVGGIFGARRTIMTDFLGQTAAGQSQKVQLFSTEEDKDTYITFRPSPRSEYQLLEASHPHGQGVLGLYWHKAASMAENIQTVGEIPRFFVLGTKNGEPDLGAWSKRMQDMLSSLPLANEWLPQLWKQLIDEEWAEPCKVFGSTAPVWMVSLKPEIWYQNIMSGIRSGSLLKLLPDPAGE